MTAEYTVGRITLPPASPHVRYIGEQTAFGPNTFPKGLRAPVDAPYLFCAEDGSLLIDVREIISIDLCARHESVHHAYCDRSTLAHVYLRTGAVLPVAHEVGKSLSVQWAKLVYGLE
jgi:hypothetical protein